MLPNVRALTAHVCDPWVNVVYVDSAPYPVCGLVFFFLFYSLIRKAFSMNTPIFFFPKLRLPKLFQFDENRRGNHTGIYTSHICGHILVDSCPIPSP